MLAAASTGCSVVARDHACWPWLSHQYRGHVPSELVRRLAHEHGTKREIGRHVAPSGYYWRKRQKAPLDVTEIRTLQGNYELAACPHAELVPTGAALLRHR